LTNPSNVTEILNGNPKFLGAPLAQGHTHFFFWWDLMMGLGKPYLRAKFCGQILGARECRPQPLLVSEN